MLNDDQASELWGFIREIPVAMMTTIDNGVIRSRPMHMVQKDFSGKLWFFTEMATAKSDEIAGTHEVGLSYEDTHEQCYASVSGSAHLTRDKALIDRFWNPMIAAWFPKGKDDPGIGLIEVEVHQAEVWEATSSRLTQLAKMAVANVRDKQPDLGKHHRYGRH